MKQSQLEATGTGSFHLGECTWQDHVVAQIDVVEHRRVALEVTRVIDSLYLEGNFKFAEHWSASPIG
ncbi:hypothetical protein D3C75_1199920 [compost metagenome]